MLMLDEEEDKDGMVTEEEVLEAEKVEVEEVEAGSEAQMINRSTTAEVRGHLIMTSDKNWETEVCKGQDLMLEDLI